MGTMRKVVATALLWLVVLGAAPARDRITVAAEDDWYPYGGVVDGEARGLGPDLVRAIFAAVDIDVSFTVVPYARCLQMAKQGQVVACLQPARTEQTEHALWWPDRPLFSARSLIYARAPSSLRGLGVRDLEGRRVAVTHGYEYGTAFDNNQAVVRQRAMREISVFRMLAAERVDFALAYEKVANLYFRQHAAEFGQRFVPVGETAVTEMYCAFSPLHPQSRHYLERFNEGHRRIEKTGVLRAIEARWP